MEQTVSKKEFKGFSGNELKVFAIIAMLMDHLASTIWPGYHKDWWLLAIHLFGRLASPTMWFMIAEGYRYTRNFIWRAFSFLQFLPTLPIISASEFLLFRSGIRC